MARTSWPMASPYPRVARTWWTAGRRSEVIRRHPAEAMPSGAIRARRAAAGEGPPVVPVVVWTATLRRRPRDRRGSGRSRPRRWRGLVAQLGPRGERRDDFGSRRAILSSPIHPAGQWIDGAGRRFLREPIEHLPVPPFDDRPVVLLAEELTPVPSEARAQPPALLDRAQRSGELHRAVVVQARVAADALALQD